MKHPFKLKNAALLMALAAAYPLTVHAAAGVAQYAVGDVSVRRGANNIPVAKGQAIESGDSIVTGTSGQTQIRFSDGGLVSLSPNSQFNINRYADENDSSKDSFAVSFLRGGMRAITGLIGKRKAENYKVTTNTATIGIRGSAFSARVNPDGTLDVAGEQDGIEVCTNAGCVSLVVGEIVRVDGPDGLPRRTAQRSNVPPLVARKDLFVPENPAEIAPIPLAGLLNGEIDGMSALFSAGTGYVDYYLRGNEEPSDGVAAFVAGQLVAHIGSSSPYSGSSSIVQKTSTEAGTFGVLGSATDPGLIAWGYWGAGSFATTGLETLVATSLGDEQQGVHYVVGRPTPHAQMPVTGAARFGLLGGTAPTAWDAEMSTLRVGTLLDAKLLVDFQQGRLVGAVNTSFNVDGETFDINIVDVAFIEGASFRSVGCGNGYFSGFFTGNQASRAGIAYGHDYTEIGNIRGTAVLLNGASGATGMAGLFASSDASFFDNTPRGGFDGSDGSAFFSGNQLLEHEDADDYYGPRLLALSGSSASFGALGNVADADFLGWGYWGQATYNLESLGTGVHHIVGRPTPFDQLPVTGTARYTLAGGTAPTAHLDGTTLTGQLLSAGLNVDFSMTRVNAYFNTSFTLAGGQIVPVLVSGTGGFEGESTFAGSDGFGSSFAGFFVGDQGARAGVIYEGLDNTVGTVRGAAAFERAGTGDAHSEQAGIVAMFASGDDFIFDFSPRGDPFSYTGNAAFIGTYLTSHNDNGSGYGGSSTLSTQSAPPGAGALGAVGDADFIGWGYWANGNASGAVGNGSLRDVHYIAGRPTPSAQMPVTGTATYDLAGGTRPTATSGGTTLIGSLVSGSLSANFSNGTVDATVNTRFTQAGGSVVSVSISDTASISGSSFSSLGCGNGTVNGFFAGNLASRAGIVYSKSGTPVGLVRGAAGFTRGASSGLSVTPPLD